MRGLSDENPNSVHAFAKERILDIIYKLQQTNQTRLPSETKLSQELGISRISIRSVLDELITEGRIYRRSGSGSYINPALSKLKATLFPTQIPQDTIRSCGYTPTASYLGHIIGEVDVTITEALELPPHTPLVTAKTLFYGDGIPCILCTDYWDCTLLSAQQLERLYEQNSIFLDLLIQATGRSVRWNLAKFSAVDTVNQPKLQTYFNVPEGVVRSYLAENNTSYDAQNRPLIHSVSIIDSHYIDLGTIRQGSIDMNMLYTEKEPFQGETL